MDPLDPTSTLPTTLSGPRPAPGAQGRSSVITGGSEEEQQVKTWFKRIEASKITKDEWIKQFRINDCYQYWRGKQRENEMDGPDRKAQHNMCHPAVDEEIPSVYFYEPYGKVVAAPQRADTPLETMSEKAKLLEDTGIALIRDKKAGFRENTFLALKESYWAFGVVEVGYDPDFIDNPFVERPALQEKADTKIAPPVGRDQHGLSVDSGSDYESLKAEMDSFKGMLGGETFYVKYIPSRQVYISPSDKAVMEMNDWIAYYEDYPLSDVKKSTAYENTADLKVAGEFSANDESGATDRVRLWRIFDFRTREKIVIAEGHDKFLMTREWKCGGLRPLRHDIDPYHFYPIPPIYLKLDAQDQYNDSAEYLRKQRISTVGRFTYDEDAVNPNEAAKFQSREMNIMIPRKAGTHQAIEPVIQPTTGQTAIQTLALGEKEFIKASASSGDPLSPPTQTATRATLAAAKMNAQEGFKRNIVGEWLAEVIQDMLLLAIDYMSLERWVAINVDLDSPMAPQEAQKVAGTFQLIDSEMLRDASLGIDWHIEVQTDTLTPVAEAERGQKLMEILNFMGNPGAAALLSGVPKLLDRILSLAGIKMGQDIDVVQGALQFIVMMNQQAPSPGVSPTGGSQPTLPTRNTSGGGPGGGPPMAAPAGVRLPVPAGVPGA